MADPETFAEHVETPYGSVERGPVRYLPVESGGEVIGYLYAGVKEKGASYIRRLGTQENRVGFAGATVWSQRLLEARKDGLSPEDALRRWIGAEERPQAGAVPAGAQFAEASSTEELRQLANPGRAEDLLPPWMREPGSGGMQTERRAPGEWEPMGPMRTEYPEGYRLVSDTPVRYLPVYEGDTLLGYVWAAESDDAAGFAERTLPGGRGARALTAWIRRFGQCKSEGLTPLQGLRRWKGAAEDPVAGRVPADAPEGRASDSAEVETYTWR
ncbi:hypothetical protein [Streptomonospora alba]|uniref:hypothetical protein n=1 Tax=Streptomonospora alba TaxID=183763 RepID=UPI00069B21D7|nr:hypothetical protein [Streptomonospora alba]